MNLLDGQEGIASRLPLKRSMFVVQGGVDEPRQILFNTFLKESKVDIHRHAFDEHFMCIKGEFDVYLYSYDDDEGISETIHMKPGDFFTVKEKIYHTVKCLTESGILMEYRQGRYNKETDKEFLISK